MCLNLFPIHLLSSGGVVASLGRAIVLMNDGPSTVLSMVNWGVVSFIGLAKKQNSFFVPSNNSRDGDICM